jgi:hypothetical protein
MPHFEDSVLLDEQVPLSKYWNSLPSSEAAAAHRMEFWRCSIRQLDT